MTNKEIKATITWLLEIIDALIKENEDLKQQRDCCMRRIHELWGE